MIYAIIYIIGFVTSYYLCSLNWRRICLEDYGWTDVLICLMASFVFPIGIIASLIFLADGFKFPKPPKFL